MTNSKQRRVVFVTHTVFHYREFFHEKVREILEGMGIKYTVLYGQPDRIEKKKSDTATLSFGKKFSNWYIYPRKYSQPLIVQPVFKEALNADLLILIQENRLLSNYLLQILPRSHRRLALFGHGRNWQSRKPNGLAERWKRIWATKADWWFAYTDETKRHLVDIGFAEDRITVFNNAIDTTELRNFSKMIKDSDLDRRRNELQITGNNIAIFVGGIYPDKRPEFLIESADYIRSQIPDFELLIAGGGISSNIFIDASKERPWLKVLGPRFGDDKVELMMLAKLFLMPGLVGLAVLDAAVLGLPIVTTRYPYHSPEIAYLEDGVTGLIVEEWESPRAYADAVLALLRDDARREAMRDAAHKLADHYTIENMAERFANGVLSALSD